MNMRYATAVLLLLSALPAESRPPPESVENHRLPALETADFTQVSWPANPASSRIARQFKRAGVQPRVWPSNISRALHETQQSGGLSGTAATPGTLHSPSRLSQPLTKSTPYAFAELPASARTARLDFGGRVFHFLMARPGEERMPNFDARLTRGHAVFDENHVRFVMVAIEEGSDQAASFVTNGEPPTVHQNVTPTLVAPFHGRADFAAVPWANGIAVIYRDRGGIYARRLNIADNSVAFESRPWLIAGAEDAVSRHQVIARADHEGNIHVLWAIRADERTSLHYCRLHLPRFGEACRHPVELSRSVAVHETLSPVNLMVQGDHVFVSWVDTRYERRGFNRTNFAKLFVAASDDGGQSFGKPVSLNRPRDNDDNARYAVTLPAEGGLLAYWTTENMRIAGQWQQQSFRVGWLDADRKQFQVGRALVAGDQLEAAITRGASYGWMGDSR